MIPVTKTYLPSIDEFTAILQRAWESGWITNRGHLVLELEEKLKQFLGVEYITTTANGTLPLQIAIKALNLYGEIITTPFSYVATTSSIVWEGCVPVFVDIDPNYLTIDENKIEAAINANTSAILATHVFGNPCNVTVIESIAKKHGLKVIYDAAHCFGVKYQNKSIFNYGDVSTCSFHATKLFHTGEGGAMITSDEDLHNKLFSHHNFQNLFISHLIRWELLDQHNSSLLSTVVRLQVLLVSRCHRFWSTTFFPGLNALTELNQCEKQHPVLTRQFDVLGDY